MKWLSLFSGIGGFDKALIENGDEVVAACEIDKYAQQIYRKHFPNISLYNDARKINPRELPDFEGLCGGFPCQAFSIAGRRKGFEDTRGTIFFEIARIAKERKPRLLLLENVKGLLSHDKGKTYRIIRDTLDEMGYTVEWQLLNSKYFVPQNRERIFIVCHLRGKCSRKVFPIGESIEWNFEPKIKYIKKSNRTNGRIYDINGIGRTLTSSESNKTGFYNDNRIKKLYGYSQCSNIYDESGLSPTISACTHGYSIGNVAISIENTKANGRRIKNKGDPQFCLSQNCGVGIYDGVKARRLTPIECERLQSFPDGYTKGLSDTQRYKCLGNAVTVDVVKCIVEKL